MKRTKIILLAFLISITTFSFVSGQEKKNEEKVKIVVADKSGTKVVIDTTFTGEKSVDSLILKDGKIIYFREKTGENDILRMPGTKHIVIKSSGEKDKKGDINEITIVGSDSEEWLVTPRKESGKVMVYSHSDDLKNDKDTRYEVIAKLEKDGEKSGTSYIYLNDGKTIREDTDARIDIKTDNNDTDGDINKARYVVAKNGIVVSIEGDDEAKVKELINLIEKRLDISKDESSDKNIDKNSEKKVEKIK